jgi:hypothetical protein
LSLAAWSLLPSNTWRTDISNVPHYVEPNLLFLLLFPNDAGTCWSASGTWQADVSLGLLLQVETFFLWHRQWLLVPWDRQLLYFEPIQMLAT